MEHRSIQAIMAVISGAPLPPTEPEKKSKPLGRKKLVLSLLLSFLFTAIGFSFLFTSVISGAVGAIKLGPVGTQMVRW